METEASAEAPVAAAVETPKEASPAKVVYIKILTN